MTKSILPERARMSPPISLVGDASTLCAAWARLAEVDGDRWIRLDDDEALLTDMLDPGDALLAFYSNAFSPSVGVYFVRHASGIRVDGFVPYSTMPPGPGWRATLGAAILDEIVRPVVDGFTPALRVSTSAEMY